MAEELKDLARRIAREHGIPEDLFLRQIGWESGWNPRARGAAGEMGLGQLMPATAAALGVRDPWDPEQNLRGAARYLAQQYRRFGDWALALAAYNAGPAAVASGRIPESTRRYVAGILGGRPGSVRSAEPDLGLAGLLAKSAGQELFLPVAGEAETRPPAQATGSSRAPERPGRAEPTLSPIAKAAAPAYGEMLGLVERQLDISAARRHKEIREAVRELEEDQFVAAIRRGDFGAAGRVLLNTFLGQLQGLATLPVRLITRPVETVGGAAERVLRDPTVRLGMQLWGLGPSLVSDLAAAALTGQTGEDAVEIISRQVKRALPREIDPRIATGSGLLAGLLFAMVTDPSNYVPITAAGKGPRIAERVERLSRALRRMEGVDGGRELLEKMAGRLLEAQTPYERAQALAEVRAVLSREIGSPAASESHRIASALLSEAGSAAAMARAEVPRELRAIKAQAGTEALEKAGVLDSYASHAVFDGTDRLATLVSRKADPQLHEQLTRAVRENVKGLKHDAGTAAADRLARPVGAADGTEYLRSIIAEPLEQTFAYLKQKYGEPIVEKRGVLEPAIVENLVSRILGKGWAGESLAKSLIGAVLGEDPRKVQEAVSAVRWRVAKALELHPDAADWYRSAGRQVLVDLQAMGITPDSPEFAEAARRVSAAYAAFSIQTDVPRNALLARKFLDEVRQLGGAEYLLRASPEDLAKVAESVARGKSHATPSQAAALKSLLAGKMGPKVGPFHLAITEGVDDALGRLPRQKLLQGVEPSADELAGLVSHYTYLKYADQLPEAWKGGFWKVPPPIDVWMGRELGIVGSLEGVQLSPSFVRVMDGYYRLTREVGRELGLLPHEVQAAWWAWSRTVGDAVTRVVTGNIPRVPVYAPYTYEDAISRLLYTQIAVEGGAGLKAADLLSGEAHALERATSDGERLGTALRVLEEQGLLEPSGATLTLGYWKGPEGIETNPVALVTFGPEESMEAATKPAQYLGAVLNQQAVGVSRVLADADYAEAVRAPALWNAVHQTFRTVDPVEGLARMMPVLPDLASMVDETSLPTLIEKLGLAVPPRAVPKVAAHLRDLLENTYVQPTRAGLRIVTTPLADPRKATAAEHAAYEIWHTLVNSAGRELVDPHMVPVAERVATKLVEVPESLKKSPEVQELFQRVWRVPSAQELKSVASAAKVATSGEAGAVLLDVRVRRDLEDVGRWLSEAMRTMRTSDYNTFEELGQRMYGDAWKALSEGDKEALYKYSVNRLVSGPGSVWRLPTGSEPGRLVEALGPDFSEAFRGLSEAGRNTLRKFEEQVEQTVQELKRGTVTDEDVARFASKIGLTPADLADIVGPGGARAVASAEEMQAVATISSEALDRFSRAFSEFMAASQSGNAELVAQAVDRARRELMTMAAARAVTFAVASEAGRSLRYFGRIKNAALRFDLESLVSLAHRDPASFEQFLAKLAGGRKLANFSPDSVRDVLAEVAQQVAKGKPLPEALGAVTGGVRQGFVDALTEWTIAAPLLAPSTSVNNILSTLANLFMEVPVQAIREVVGPRLGAKVAQGEAAAFASTFLTAVVETFPDFLKLMADVLAGRPIVAESKWLEAGRALIPGKGIVGRLKHVAFGSLMAQDAWLTAASARAEYMRLAERRILAERLVREAVHGVDDANLAARLSEVAAEIRTLSPSVADDIARALVSSPDASALRATLTRKIAPDRAPDIRRLELLAAPRVDLVEEAREAARRLTWNNDPPLFVADMIVSIPRR